MAFFATIFGAFTVTSIMSKIDDVYCNDVSFTGRAILFVSTAIFLMLSITVMS